MLFMNEYEVHEMARLYYGHPVLRPATQTLEALVDWTNDHSDGWCYWPKPCRAARQLQELIGTMRNYLDDPERKDVTAEALSRAYRPLKAFRTRQGADFAIYTARARTAARYELSGKGERAVVQEATEHLKRRA